MHSIGMRLRLVRGNVPQEEFAKRVGVSAGALSHYETGRRLPKSATLDNIAEVAKTSKEWLLTGHMPLQDRPGVRGLQMSGDQCGRFISSFEEITPQLKVAVLALMVKGLELKEIEVGRKGVFDLWIKDLQEILDGYQDRAIHGAPADEGGK